LKGVWKIGKIGRLEIRKVGLIEDFRL